MQSTLRDVAYAFRSLRKNPAFTLTALITLALGIGASTAIFSVVNAVLLRPLPYANPQTLTIVTSDLAARNVNDFPFPAADIKDMRDEGKLFSGLAAVFTFKQAFTDDNGQAQLVRGANVTTNLFSLLGARVAAGRDFRDDDGTPQAPLPAPGAPGAGGAAAPPSVPATAILSYGFWQRQFGGDRSVIGKMISIGGGRALVVGVAPRDFELLFPPRFHVATTPDIYTAARINWATASRINVAFRIIGRMKPGVSVSQAQSQMDGIVTDLKQRFPIKATAGLRFRVVPMHQELVSDVRAAILALMGGVTFVLLVGSGLMLRSFALLARANPGFDPEGMLTFNAANPDLRTPEQRAAFVRVMQQRLAALPGVTAVTTAFPLPFDGQESNARWGTEVAVNDPAAFQQADVAVVVPGYFDVMRTRLLAGRAFTEADNVPTSTSVMIDRVLAAKAFPGQSAIGRRLFVRFRGDQPEWLDVIGVVDQERRVTPAADGREQIYFTDGQIGFGGGTWVVRTAGDPAQLGVSVRGAVAQIDPLTLVTDVQPMSVYVNQVRAPTRFALALIGAFAVIALVLAAVGLYGVLSTVVRQRTAEIGVRMAFGAPKERIFRQMIGEGMRLSVVGVGVGVLAALALTRAMASMLVGVKPTDPITFVAIAVLFLGIAALSCWLPARRAAAMDPAIALRDD
ncbi:MAG TPA: ABC transporter permease [Gemmatimonadaceae bacterium]